MDSELVKDYMNYNFLSFAKNIQGALKKANLKKKPNIVAPFAIILYI